ncbi:MAG TPA: hypothetical protein VJN18_21645 [Polyangiaceae bacterium]|nr:hypothetical protein [Polyangiaceae bacterium]
MPTRRSSAPGWLRLVLPCLLPLCLASAAHAKSPLTVDVQPMLGTGTPAVDGWLSAYVRIDNRGPETVRGNLSVDAELSWARMGGGPRNTTQVPFSVPARSQVSVEVPVHGFPGTSPGLHAVARGSDGQLLAEAKSAELRTPDPLVFDLTSPSHVAPALRNIAVPLAHTRWGGVATPVLSVSSPRSEPRTGEPVVPRTASGYASVTLVLGTPSELGRMSEEARAALSDWLLAGGALALALERPEDLRLPYVTAWAGGSINEEGAPAPLGEEAVFAIPIDPGVPTGPGTGGGTSDLRLSPSSDSRGKLRGYRGGNLRPTPWGAAASYGLGELHLLAFRPNAEPFVSDPWAHHKLADLTRHAWDRAASVALPHAEATLDEGRLRLVRRELDPNQGSRWTIVVSALLLLTYAGLAGPLNFYLARRRGTPLRALSRLPLWSVLTLALVVLLGVAGRGISGRARRLSLIEAGAGMSRASVTRFRGLYASSTQERVVQASARGNVLDVAGDAEETGRRLVVDRDGARLTNLRGRPWEVVMVEEDGFMGLGGGVSLLRGADGQLTVKNRLGRDLLGVVLMPGSTGSARFFARIKDGEAVTESAGKPVTIARSVGFGRSSLNLGPVSDMLDHSAKGLSSAWEAIEGATTRNIDFWPVDIPVLIGQLDGGEGKLTDSGFPLEADRTLLRVVGEGGVP